MSAETTFHKFLKLTGEPVSASILALVEVLRGPAQLMTIEEASVHLQVSTRTLYGLVGDGAIPHLRIGSAIRFKRADLDQFSSEQNGVDPAFLKHALN